MRVSLGFLQGLGFSRVLQRFCKVSVGFLFGFLWGGLLGCRDGQDGRGSLQGRDP